MKKNGEKVTIVNLLIQMIIKYKEISMIRDALKRRILETLNIPPRICSEDFYFSTKDSGGTTELRIEYTFNRQNYYKAIIPNMKVEQSLKTPSEQAFEAVAIFPGHVKADFEIAVEYAPGEISVIEKFKFGGVKGKKELKVKACCAKLRSLSLLAENLK